MFQVGPRQQAGSIAGGAAVPPMLYGQQGGSTASGTAGPPLLYGQHPVMVGGGVGGGGGVNMVGGVAGGGMNMDLDYVDSDGGDSPLPVHDYGSGPYQPHPAPPSPADWDPLYDENELLFEGEAEGSGQQAAYGHSSSSGNLSDQVMGGGSGDGTSSGGGGGGGGGGTDGGGTQAGVGRRHRRGGRGGGTQQPLQQRLGGGIGAAPAGGGLYGMPGFDLQGGGGSLVPLLAAQVQGQSGLQQGPSLWTQGGQQQLLQPGTGFAGSLPYSGFIPPNMHFGRNPPQQQQPGPSS